MNSYNVTPPGGEVYNVVTVELRNKSIQQEVMYNVVEMYATIIIHSKLVCT